MTASHVLQGADLMKKKIFFFLREILSTQVTVTEQYEGLLVFPLPPQEVEKGHQN